MNRGVAALFPGDRRVWIAAGVVLAVLAVYALTVLLKPHEELVGTNSVAPVAPIDTAARGEQVCTGVRIPPRASFVQVFVGLPEATRSTLDASLRTGDGTTKVIGSTAVVPGMGYKNVPIDPAPTVREGELCLVSDSSRIDLGGAATGHVPGEAPLRIGARERADVELSVRFLRSEWTRSLASLLPGAPGRANVFRPGALGPWTYWLIGLLGLPTLAYVGLRLLATAGSDRLRRAVFAMAGIAFLVSAGWAVTTPLFQAPDESEHFAYAQHLAEVGEVPEREPGSKPPYSSEAGLLLLSLRHSSSIHMGATRPRWLTGDRQAWERAEETEQPPRDNGGGYSDSAHAHSPLYYGALAPAYLAAARGDLTWRVTLMRLLTAALASVIAACAMLTVRELLPGHPALSVAAGLLVAFQPVVSFMGGAINNDTAVNAAAAVAIYLVVRALRRGLTVGTAIGIGVALVALPLAKVTGYGVVPAVIVGLLIAIGRAPRNQALRLLAAAGGTIVIASLAWTRLIAPWLAGGAKGTLVNTPAAQPSQSIFQDPLLYLGYLIQTFAPPIQLKGNLTIGWPFYEIYIERAFGRFGWVTIGFPPFVYRVILVVAIGLAILAAAAAVRNRSLVRARWAPALVLTLAALGVVSFIAVAYTSATPRLVSVEQGRYAFPALVPIAALAAFACLGLGRRRAPVVAGAVVGAMIALGFGGWLQALAGWYV